MDCIAAISTPLSSGGVSMIRISGSDALSAAKAVFKPKYPVRDIDKMDGYTAAYGDIMSGDKKLDDGILLVYRAPHSYTGEDVAEITCHGGILITKKVLKSCLDAGARLAAAGEFTKRALLNGKLSLTEAESVIDLINAGSEQLISCATAQKDGALFRRTEALCEELANTASEIAVWIDYPDESEDEDEISRADWLGAIGRIKDDIADLLDSYDSGRVMKEGITAAIAGKPNAGKSTLMNLLTGTQKSIVTDIEGTTRDIVEETVMLDDIILHLSDCAGIRETSDTVERIGVEKMLSRLNTAQLIFAVFDGSRTLSDEDFDFIGRIEGKNVIPIINKSDLDQTADIDFISQRLGKAVVISAKSGDGLAQLSQAVRERCRIKRLDPSAGFLANERQYRCADEAMRHVTAAYDALYGGMTADVAGLELEAALSALYELSGKSASDEVIDRIFERFCVGK